MSTCGVLYIHSAPPALCPHVEWAVAGVMGRRVDLPWSAQPASPGMLRAETCWQGEPGTAAAIASALRDWQLLRFEVTEEPAPGSDGVRYSCTPSLGLFTALTGANGDILIPENRLRAAMVTADGATSLRKKLDELLGRPWDEELEPFRYAGDGAPVRWLHAG